MKVQMHTDKKKKKTVVGEECWERERERVWQKILSVKPLNVRNVQM